MLQEVKYSHYLFFLLIFDLAINLIQVQHPNHKKSTITIFLHENLFILRNQSIFLPSFRLVVTLSGR